MPCHIWEIILLISTMKRNKRNLKAVKPKYVVVVEGECEFWYVQMLKRNERSIPVDLEPKIPHKKCLSEQYEMVIGLSMDYDKVFWLIDFDLIIRESRTAAKQNKTPLQEFREYYQRIAKKYNNIQIIINNPCLEFWFLLHFEYTSKYFERCDQVIRYMKKYSQISDYQKNRKYYTKQGNDIYLKLKPYLMQAKNNAARLEPLCFDNYHFGISQMHRLFGEENPNNAF